MLFRLKIIEDAQTLYTSWAQEENSYVTYAVEQARFASPTGVISVERMAGAPPAPINGGGSYGLAADPSPTLGGDLQLNGHVVVGSLETESLILDGGLVG